MNVLGTTVKKKHAPMDIDPKAFEKVRDTDFGYDYWDNPDFPGHKGYHYDGRWREPAKEIIDHFSLTNASRVLDVGCGKGYLLYELQQWLPDLQIAGLDISQYAIENSKEEVRDALVIGSADALPFADKQFDLVISLATVYMLPKEQCFKAIQEIQRVGRDALIQTVSFRSEEERRNMERWDMGAVRKSIDEWEGFYRDAGYTGMRSWFIFAS